MRLSLGQDLRMVQTQTLSPQMIQSIEILQLPILALQERIEQELQENPLLELLEIDPDAPEETGEDRELPDAPADSERELVIDEATSNEDDFERLANMAEEWPDMFEERSRPSRNQTEEAGDHKHGAAANKVAHPQTLQDYLHGQLIELEIGTLLRVMTESIIGNLDHNGYLRGGLKDLLGADASKDDLAVAQQALSLVQRLDPLGVGARDLRECLLIQLKPRTPMYEEMKTLITSHLEDIEHDRLPIISRKTGLSIERIQDAIAELRKLNPKPGADFGEQPVPPVPPLTPDVFVDQTENGGYTVRLEDARLPTLFISPYYLQLLSTGQETAEATEYIKRKINSAQWLIDSIEQRRNTLTQVSQAIVDHQTEFLSKGPESIAPLTMQQIADKVGVHVTTVSRAVDDKRIQTPRGIFPLKQFFCRGTVSADGEDVAWDTVRLKLQALIDNEDKQNPLSDSRLVAKLAEQGLDVARATVAKYRKSRKIPNSRDRRDRTAGRKRRPTPSDV